MIYHEKLSFLNKFDNFEKLFSLLFLHTHMTNFDFI